MNKNFNTDFNLTKERIYLRNNIDYLFSKINWKSSFLDAKAITIMNNLMKNIINTDMKFIHAIKSYLDDINKKPIDHDIIDKLAGKGYNEL